MGARVESVSDTAGGVTVAVADTQTGRKYEIVGDAVLLATGRRPATAGLNLAAAGIETDDRGAVRVDAHLRTTAPHVFAAGDVTGGLQFTYVSLDDFRIIRDVLLGVFPPRAFYSYEYLAVAFFTALAVFIAVWGYKVHYERFQTPLKNINNVFDAIGLAAFSIVGSQLAVSQGYADNPFLCVFLGMTTGIGGGILRDVLSKEVPYVFQKHVYGVASLLGCVAYWTILRLTASDTAAALTGVFLIILIRICATVFRWNLPRIRLENKQV